MDESYTVTINAPDGETHIIPLPANQVRYFAQETHDPVSAALYLAYCDRWASR